VTAGDPAGIGPEIVAAALGDGRLPAAGRIAVFAHADLFDEACRAGGRAPLPRLAAEADGPWPRLVPVDVGAPPSAFAVGAPSAFSGAVAAACVRAAARAALDRHVDAVVTAPLSKTALAAAGVPFPGHTEMLADLAGADAVAMMFVAPELRVTLATIHVPLVEVAERLTRERLVTTIRLTRECLVERLRLSDPRIALLGLNPHAGEEGLFGSEEARTIVPALQVAQERGWSVDGPFPADSFFFRRAGEFDAVIAMYHDQGLIPVKLLARGRAVNVTLGLPFLRTSVDHGTAFEIAGRGVASADSLVEAARLAAEWTS
jgi:4-hydroxythreonine-4-phosphate dehydrogenase